jgi:hypothetical protein
MRRVTHAWPWTERRSVIIKNETLLYSILWYSLLTQSRASVMDIINDMKENFASPGSWVIMVLYSSWLLTPRHARSVIHFLSVCISPRIPSCVTYWSAHRDSENIYLQGNDNFRVDQARSSVPYGIIYRAITKQAIMALSNPSFIFKYGWYWLLHVSASLESISVVHSHWHPTTYQTSRHIIYYEIGGYGPQFNLS